MKFEGKLSAWPQDWGRASFIPFEINIRQNECSNHRTISFNQSCQENSSLGNYSRLKQKLEWEIVGAITLHTFM